MIVKIKPLDTLFFRDGKPFGIGEETWAGSFVLPNPSVVWGALFSMLLSRNLVLLNEVDKLKIGRIFLYDETKYLIYLPAPLDLFKETAGQQSTIFASLDENIVPISNYPLKQLIFPVTNNVTETVDNHFININDFYDGYYRNDIVTIKSIHDLHKRDYKIGIGRNNQTKTAEENQLYRVALTELNQDWCFLVEVETNIEFPPHGILKLGGEGKTASFEIVTDEVKDDVLELEKQLEEKFSKNKQNVFKLYFTAPAFFKNGWYEAIFETEFQLLAAFIGKPMGIGGFEMKEPKPMVKPMLKAIPAGSVYYLRNKSLTYQAAKQQLKSQLSLLNQNGFGTFELLPYL